MPYFDRNTKDVVAHEVIAAMAIEAKLTPHQVAKELGLITVVRGGGEGKQLGKECKHCGSPMGSVEPDDCKWVMLSTCHECSGMY